jgi:hypothetical protein
MPQLEASIAELLGMAAGKTRIVHPRPLGKLNIMQGATPDAIGDMHADRMECDRRGTLAAKRKKLESTGRGGST